MVGALLVTLWLCMVTLSSGSGKDAACDGSACLSQGRADLRPEEENWLQGFLSIYNIPG